MRTVFSQLDTNFATIEQVAPSPVSKFLELTPSRQRRIVVAACSALHDHYGSPRLGNPTDPFLDLVYIILSNRTSPKLSLIAFDAVIAAYPNHAAMRLSSKRRLAKLLQSAGLANKRASHLREIGRRIFKTFGAKGLLALEGRPAEEVELFLTGLPGVSLKVAKCVMMYTLGFHVLPVDTHVHRITSRLGWTRRKRADQCHAELERLVPPKLRYDFHVDCLVHGREVCSARKPNCASCMIQKYCEYYREKHG